MGFSRAAAPWCRAVSLAAVLLACGSSKSSSGGGEVAQGGPDTGGPDAGTVTTSGTPPPADGGTGTSDGGTSNGGTGGPDAGGLPSACDGLVPALGAAVTHEYMPGTHASCSVATSSPGGQVALGISGSFAGNAATVFDLFSADGTVLQGSIDLLIPAVVPGSVPEIDPWFHSTSSGYQGIVHDLNASPPPVALRTWSASGTALGDAPDYAVASAPDGAGGSVLLGRTFDAGASSPLGPTHLEWLDAGGHVLRSVLLDDDPTLVEVAWGTGHVLAIVPGTPTSRARWFDGVGAPLTPWFDAAAPIPGNSAALRLLLDGRVVLGDGRTWLAAFRDGVAGADAAPGWLASRPNTRLATIRQGRAYAVLPLDQPDVDQTRFEIVTAAEESCGTVAIPPPPPAAGVTRTPGRVDVGQDGTLFQRMIESPSSFGITCMFQWWPGLLR